MIICESYCNDDKNKAMSSIAKSVKNASFFVYNLEESWEGATRKGPVKSEQRN